MTRYVQAAAQSGSPDQREAAARRLEKSGALGHFSQLYLVHRQSELVARRPKVPPATSYTFALFSLNNIHFLRSLGFPDLFKNHKRVLKRSGSAVMAPLSPDHVPDLKRYGCRLQRKQGALGVYQ